MHAVSIIYRFLPRWRADFFEQLKGSLEAQGVQLHLFYGKNPAPQQLSRRLKWGDEVDLSWGTTVKNRLLKFEKYELIWQSLPSEVFESDLIILMQENSLISNYWTLLKSRARKRRTAFWGHGINHQNAPGSFNNRFKEMYSTHVDWWFAYTASVARKIVSSGFPKNRITVVENAIDTEELIRTAHDWNSDRLQLIR